MRRPFVLAIAGVAAAFAPAAATVYEVSPGADLQSFVDALAPGDELVLHGGTYVLSSRFSIQAVGTPTRPIVVRAMDGETPVVQYVDGSQNVINVENAAHLVLRGLTLTGGSHGIRISASNFVTVEKCHVHDVGDVTRLAEDAGLRLAEIFEMPANNLILVFERSSAERAGETR